MFDVIIYLVHVSIDNPQQGRQLLGPKVVHKLLQLRWWGSPFAREFSNAHKALNDLRW